MEYKDYYKILGVDKNATEKDIKKVYRRLARQYHPDVNPGDSAAETRFKEINEAYEVLSDPDKRRKYDELGQNYQHWQQAGQPGGFDWTQWAQRQGAAPGGQGGVRVEYGDVNDLFGNGGFSDFFETIFGSGMGGTAGGTRRATRVPLQDVEQEIDITLVEAYNGTQRRLEMEGRRLEVRIPAGVKTGSRVRVPAEGVGGQTSGIRDVYLRVNVLPHPSIERRGDDMHVEVPLDMFTALLGGEARVPTITGSLALRIPPGTQAGRIFRLAGQGMPKLRTPNEHGDLYAKVRIRLPEDLSDRERELVREWAELRGVAVP